MSSVLSPHCNDKSENLLYFDHRLKRLILFFINIHLTLFYINIHLIHSRQWNQKYMNDTKVPIIILFPILSSLHYVIPLSTYHPPYNPPTTLLLPNYYPPTTLPTSLLPPNYYPPPRETKSRFIPEQLDTPLQRYRGIYGICILWPWGANL